MKIVLALFLMVVLSCAAVCESFATEISTSNTIQKWSNPFLTQSSTAVADPNKNKDMDAKPKTDSVNCNQGVNYNVKPQYRPSVYNSSRVTNMNPFSISAFFNRIMSSSRAGQTPAAIDVQKKSMQYNPSQNTSVMDYIRTKILRLQK